MESHFPKTPGDDPSKGRAYRDRSATRGFAVATAIEGMVAETDNRVVKFRVVWMGCRYALTRAILACFGLTCITFEGGCVDVRGEARRKYENQSFGDHGDAGVHVEGGWIFRKTGCLRDSISVANPSIWTIGLFEGNGLRAGSTTSLHPV
ncbi:hypothetical protein KEM48_006172 [Puccinia striiformis f. sp. tritici PST-130]|nr:hypothetical protein KEM48_006172 [Puccinia striiformis f. sp. tritici PST-130]